MKMMVARLVALGMVVATRMFAVVKGGCGGEEDDVLRLL